MTRREKLTVAGMLAGLSLQLVSILVSPALHWWDVVLFGGTCFMFGDCIGGIVEWVRVRGLSAEMKHTVEMAMRLSVDLVRAQPRIRN